MWLNKYGMREFMWTYSNPVNVIFGAGEFGKIAEMIGGRSYALITYPDEPFQDLTVRLIKKAGRPVLIINDIAPNPDYELLAEQSGRFQGLDAPVDVIVALGGGSVIDSAKVFAAANGDFTKVAKFLETKEGEDQLPSHWRR